MSVLQVADLYGPDWLDQGPDAGTMAAFLRLAGCTLYCTSAAGPSWWCDHPFSRDPFSFSHSVTAHPVTVETVAARVHDLDVPLLVVTGGEPLLQRAALADLLPLLPDLTAVDVHTNATRPPLAGHRGLQVRRYVASIHLASSGVRPQARIVPTAIRALKDTGQAVWTFEVANLADVEEATCLAVEYDLDDVWCIPAAETPDTIGRTARLVAPLVAAAGFNLSVPHRSVLSLESTPPRERTADAWYRTTAERSV